MVYHRNPYAYVLVLLSCFCPLCSPKAWIDCTLSVSSINHDFYCLQEHSLENLPTSKQIQRTQNVLWSCFSTQSLQWKCFAKRCISFLMSVHFQRLLFCYSSYFFSSESLWTKMGQWSPKGLLPITLAALDPLTKKSNLDIRRLSLNPAI